MSDSRKEFEAAHRAGHNISPDDQYAFQRYASQPEDYWNDIVQRRWEGWQLALSVAPAPVAAEPVAWRYKHHGSDENSPWHLIGKPDRISVWDAEHGVKPEPLFAAPPVQEGPKGCRIEATHHFDDRTIAGSFTIPAQSIPAAIDEEGREALKVALVYMNDALRDSDYAQDTPDEEVKALWVTNSAALRKHIAAIERLLSGN